jgi:hypothetical protein
MLTGQEGNHIVTCPFCGEVNPPLVMHCEHCQKALVPATSANPLKQPVKRIVKRNPPLKPRSLPEQEPEQRCPNCGIYQGSGVWFCESCGIDLDTGQPGPLSTGTGPLLEPSTQRYARRFDKLEPETQPVETHTDRPTHTNTVSFTNDSVLSMEITGFDVPVVLVIAPNQFLTIGRGDPALGLIDIDLTPYNGQTQGISRHHAAIQRRGSRLYLWDLNSTNGTYLNQAELKPDQQHKLGDGDEIVLGKLAFTVRFQTKPVQ